MPALAGCSLFQEDTQYNPAIDPAQFVKVIDNRYLPLVPGTTHRFRSTSDEGVEDIVVTVTTSTKVIAGITTTVVHDVATRGSQLHEDTEECERGKVSTEGSWETGVKGAKPGIVMPAHPSAGQMNRQEYLVGEAEDESQIIALGETVTVAAGTFSGCVKTKEWSRLEPGLLEHKYYAPGVGVVAEATVEGGTEKVALVSR